MAVEKLSKHRPNPIFYSEVERIPSFSTVREFNATRIVYNGTDVHFERPYRCTPGIQYALRRVKGKWQLWEVEPTEELHEFEWVAEAKH